MWKRRVMLKLLLNSDFVIKLQIVCGNSASSFSAEFHGIICLRGVFLNLICFQETLGNCLLC